MAELNAGPRVSVIIIFLNEERYLAEAVESVRMQTFPDWELILVDDGSTDRSGDIARSLSDGDRIRYVAHPNGENRGMSASRNAGLAVARGELIAFLDADDIWLPGKLADQVAIFDALPEADMIYGRTLIWHEWEAGATTQDYFYDLGVQPDRLHASPSLLPVLIGNRAQTPTTINAIMRRALVDRVGGFEEPFRGMFEDQAFFAKTHLVARCYVDDRIWAKYRQHQSSCTAQSSGTLHDLQARRTFLRWLTRYLLDARAYHPKVLWTLVGAWLQLWKGLGRWRLRRALGRV